MKMYVLRWNPNFSMKYEEHVKGMDMLRKNPVHASWSIYDHEDLEEGDIFIFNQVGSGEEDGIAGFGTFTCEPYTEANWKQKDGTNRFYAEFLMELMLDRRGGNIFSAAEMEKVLPEIDWHKGHAGVLVEDAVAEKVILHLMQKTLYMSKPTEKIAFTAVRKAHPLAPLFARYINGLCPSFREKIISLNKLTYKDFEPGEDVDPMLIEISTKKFNGVSLTEKSTLDEIAKLFVPVA
jgi:hypothetical protein